MVQSRKCKYCGSTNLYIEPKNAGEDPLTADTVALKCRDCGKWLGWCAKANRSYYLRKAENFNETQKVEEVIKKEEKVEISPKKTPKDEVLDFVHEQRQIVIECFSNEKNKAIAVLDKISRFIAQKL